MGNVKVPTRRTMLVREKRSDPPVTKGRTFYLPSRCQKKDTQTGTQVYVRGRGGKGVRRGWYTRKY